MTKRHETEIDRLKEEYGRQISELDDELDMFEAENNELKEKLQETERELSEVESSYDRDKALWEDKFVFLENQKNQAKKDLQDAHFKFEMTVEQLHKKDTNDRGKTESAQALLISSIEKKYKDQIKDMTESHNQSLHEQNMRYKQIEKEYKELKEKYEIETRGKLAEYGTMERKIKEYIENEQKLHDEIKDLKNQRDRKCLENQSVLERKKDNYKQKVFRLSLTHSSTTSKRRQNKLSRKDHSRCSNSKKKKPSGPLKKTNFPPK